jgi:hypothetical protein
LFHAQDAAGLPAISPFQRAFNNPGPSLIKRATDSLFFEIHQQRGAPEHAARFVFERIDDRRRERVVGR